MKVTLDTRRFLTNLSSFFDRKFKSSVSIVIVSHLEHTPAIWSLLNWSFEEKETIWVKLSLAICFAGCQLMCDNRELPQYPLRIFALSSACIFVNGGGEWKLSINPIKSSFSSRHLHVSLEPHIHVPFCCECGTFTSNSYSTRTCIDYAKPQEFANWSEINHRHLNIFYSFNVVFIFHSNFFSH